MIPSRTLQATLYAAVILQAALLAVGGLSGSPERWWGLHAWSMLPPVTLAGLAVAALGFAAAVFVPFRFPASPRGIVLAGLLAFPLFLLFRDHAHLLGDGRLWISVAEQGPVFQSHEPLAFASSWAAVTLFPLGSVTFRLELWSAVLGTGGVMLIALLAGRVGASDRDRWFTFVLLAGAGTIQFAFGYVESYPALWFCMLLYLWCTARYLQEGKGAGWVGVTLGLAVAVHGSAVMLVPAALLALVFRRPGHRDLLGFLGGAVFPVAFAYLLLPQLMLSASGEKAGVGSVLSGSTMLLGGLGAYDHGFAAWVVDQVNRWSLAAPAALLLVAPALFRGIRTDRDRRDLPAVFGAAALLMMLPALVLDTEGSRGSAADWDNFAVAGVPLALTAATLWTGGPGVGGRMRLPAALLAGLVALTGLGFVLANACDRIAPRRLEVLAASPTWSPDARALAYESLALFYRSRADSSRAADMYLQAIEHQTGNARLLRNTAILLGRVGRHREAADVYARLASGNADPGIWMRLARERDLAGDPDGAETALREALARDDTLVDGLNQLARILITVRTDRESMIEAHALIRRSLSLAPSQPEADGLERTLAALEARGIDSR